MKKLLWVASTMIAVLAMQTASQAVTVEAVVNARRVNNFIEFKVESDQKGERSTAPIRNVGKYRRIWNMGGSNQSIWFWWDNLEGEADLTLKVDGVVVFDGSCFNYRNGEVNVRNVCRPRVWKLWGAPRIQTSGKSDAIFFY